MNKATVIFVAAVAIIAPVTVLAQATQQPITRAQVRAELVELERAGYNPNTAGDNCYPADIQAAEAKVTAEHAAAGRAVGGVPGRGSESGSAFSADK
jgi:hypothetical protein